MIVTCERCSTQFQLDDARIPDVGVRVRCSLCKHAFVVTRPDPARPEPEPDPIHAAAERAVASGETPDVTHDLDAPCEDEGHPPAAPEGPASAEEAFAAADEDLVAAADEALAAAADEALAAADEDLAAADEDLVAAADDLAAEADDGPLDWGFADAPREPERDPGPEPGPASPALAADEGPGDEPLFAAADSEIGDSELEISTASEHTGELRDPHGEEVPADPDALFDLAVAEGVDGAELGPPDGLALAADAPDDLALAADASDDTDELGSPGEWDIVDDAAAAPRAASGVPGRRRDDAVVASVHVSARLDGAEAADAAPSPWLGRAGHAAGWFATAALCAVGLLRGLTPAPTLSAALASPAPGFELEQVRARWVDNVHLGGVYVVSLELRNAGPDVAAAPVLELVWLDAAGRPIERPVTVSEPRGLAVLREGRPAALRAQPTRSPGLLRPGESRSLEAVAAAPPRSAEHYLIRRST